MATNKDMRYLNLLFEEAKDSQVVSGQRVAACLVFKKTLVIIGHNAYRTDPWASRYAKNDDANCIHAEVQAIKNAVNHFRGEKIARDFIKNATLYVCRAKKTGPGGEWVWGLAAPCEGCKKAIADFGIKRVVWSTDDHEVSNEMSI